MMFALLTGFMAAYAQQSGGDYFEGLSRKIGFSRMIPPHGLEITYDKTVHVIFPSPIKYVDLGSTNLIAGKADGAENVRCHGDDLILGDILRVELCGVICRVIRRLLGIDRLLVYGLLRVNRRLGLLLGCLRLCCRLLRDPGGLRLCRYGRTASCAEGAVFGDLCSAFFTKSHKFLPSFRADTRSRHAAAVSLRINFYCFYYNKFDFGCKCLSGNFKKTSAALPMFCLRLRKRVKHTHFSKIKPGF